MKVYKLGDPANPTIMLFPGTCCYWKTNFGHVFENLQKYFYVMVVSYSGFDETENTTFISELDEVRKVEHYIQSELHGQLFAAYGCSLGGSFVSLLVSRRNVHIDHAIIGSSDMDQAPKWLAKIETAIVLPLFYPFITGKKNCFLRKKIDKRLENGGDEAEYMKKFLDIMGINSGIDFSFISKESIKNQFCTDLYTKVGEQIHVDGTTIHVFYAKKMGDKYLNRYLKYFKNPDICEFDLGHEELLLDAERWTREVCRVCGLSE